MNARFFLLTIALACLGSAAAAAEPVNIPEAHRQIVADYQQIVAATLSANVDDAAAVRLAADRLARAACRDLIRQAAALEDPTADDLYTMGICHEVLGEIDEAIAQHQRSLEKREQATPHLALARLLLARDVKQAETHFAEAARLQPGLPELPSFHLRAAEILRARRQWSEAARHLERWLGYAKILSDRVPGSQTLDRAHEAVAGQLDLLRRYAGTLGESAPSLTVEAWIQGEPVAIPALKGRVVLLDFFAVWADPSRQRIELIKRLSEKHGPQGLEVIGFTLPYSYRYDAEADRASFEKDLSAEDERAGVAAFAAKHEITWRLGVVSRENTAVWGVETLPFTVLLDGEGRVQFILLAPGDDGEQELEAKIEELLKSK